VVKFTPRPLYSGIRVPGTHWIRSRLALRAGQDAVEKRKKSPHCTCRELNRSRPARGLASALTEVPRLPTRNVNLQKQFKILKIETLIYKMAKKELQLRSCTVFVEE